MKYLFLIIVAALAAACGEDKDPMPQDFDRSGEAMTVTVHTYPDQKSMQNARARHDGMNDPALLGWAAWTAAPPAKCDIHVVRLQSARDRGQMTTWGHELAHCVYGGYHRE